MDTISVFPIISIYVYRNYHHGCGCHKFALSSYFAAGTTRRSTKRRIRAEFTGSSYIYHTLDVARYPKCISMYLRLSFQINISHVYFVYKLPNFSRLRYCFSLNLTFFYFHLRLFFCPLFSLCG